MPSNKRPLSRSRSSFTSGRPLIQSPNGMRLGTPLAREAARSFWSRDMLKTSLNRMAFYADCEGHSSLGSLDSTADSGFHSITSSTHCSERATPTITRLPLLTTSAPSSPSSAKRNESKSHVPTESDDMAGEMTLLQQPMLCPVSNSPLLVARREREEAAQVASSKDSTNSTASLSSSKTISPSLSAHVLLPRRKQHRRSLSAEYKREPVSHTSLFPKGLKARSDSKIYKDLQLHMNLRKSLNSF